MPRITENRRMRWSAEQMYDLVADVGRYAEFLPWVVATRVKSDSEHEMIADMLVGFSALREKFTSRVLKERPSAIKVEYIEGPLKRLENTWSFKPEPDGGCTIEFCVDFTFRSAIFEKLAGQYLDAAFRKMVAAFEKRAEQLYGNSSPSAVSVA
ncbi:type II toxin-antitoxin system RatA family toxin [Novosphingobium sp. B1]|uniref:type II toxin-antitoxin system RatA family toxin n=1 Tax=Novosphingobium sp. B1 TaxID=1938756 RepID=UPI000A05CA87|nr:type II toxin-antitoxin system RatA family toxin [Novosphingobium sp. B1]